MFFARFLEYLVQVLDDDMDKYNFQISNVTQHFIDFFANFSPALLIKKLLIKKYAHQEQDFSHI